MTYSRKLNYESAWNCEIIVDILFAFLCSNDYTKTEIKYPFACASVI